MNAPSPKQAALDLIKQAQNIAIFTHRNPDGDALGSILALSAVLNKLEKKVRIVILGEPDPGLEFLPGYSLPKHHLLTQELTLSLAADNSETTLFFRKDDQTQKLEIKLNVDGQPIDPASLTMDNHISTFDLFIVLDVSDKEQLLELTQRHQELFKKTPILNIDHHKTNSNFGAVNVVDSNATATAEVLVSLIEALQGKNSLFDPDIATCLLAGILTDTALFQNQNTTPKSLTVAAQLVALGGRRSEIVKKLFMTKSVTRVKLTGRIIERLQEDNGFYWSFVTANDFKDLAASEIDLNGIIDEELKVIDGAKFTLLLSELKDGLKGGLRTVREDIDVSILAKQFGGGGHKGAAGFFIKDATLKDRQEEVINAAKAFNQGI